MNTQIYTPSEIVRLELLQYENPEGLHPIEQEWRNLARKLMEHVKASDMVATIFYEKLGDSVKRYLPEELKDWKPFKFPSKFTSNI